MDIVNELVPTLRNTPQVLRALLHGLPKDLLYVNEGENSWSAYDIVGHLIHGEKTDWIPRARIILGGGGQFEPFDRFAQFEASKGKSIKHLLTEFEILRNENIYALLDFKIGPAQLTMTGNHPEFGTVTLEQLLSTWMVHDLGHIAQIARVFARTKKDAAGPWQAYLPILTK